MPKRVMRVALVFLMGSVAYAGPDTITYQGSLLNSLGGPVTNGTYQMEFKIFDAATDGTNRWQEGQDIQVTSGLFATTLGEIVSFDGFFLSYPDLWLEVTIDLDHSGTFEAEEVFSPRQNLTGVPWACPRLVPNAESPNLIGGYRGNYVTGSAYGATIGGGGRSGAANRVTDDYGTIGGGTSNLAGNSEGTLDDADHATVAGGGYNDATEDFATVGGGSDNDAHAIYATIAGGFDNEATGLRSTVGGGRQNRASGGHTTIAGGDNNTASAAHATVSGGHINEATGNLSAVGGGEANMAVNTCSTVAGGSTNEASGLRSTVGGGIDNTASGDWATVPGGLNNTASGNCATVCGGWENTASGNRSFAAGFRANANKAGAFVWADSSVNEDFTATWENQFRVRATGGVTFRVNNPPDDQWIRFKVLSGHLIDTSANGAHLTVGGSWTNGSDRNQKENFASVDGRHVLAQLAEMPVQTWNYKAEEPSVRRIGPTAQDFYAAFGLGEDDLHISTVDANGVALAAIQGLHQIVQEKDAEITELKTRLAALEAVVAAQADQESRNER